MAVSKPIASRREMLGIFDARIQNTQSDLLDQTELEFGRNMLKTAIIESNISREDFLQDGDWEEAHKIDSDIHMVRVENTEGEGWLFFDFYEERFWTVYSIAKSRFFKYTVEQILKEEGGGLDRLWLPAGEIEEIGTLGDYEGVKISFGANDVFPDEFIEDNLQFTDLDIDGSGQSSKHLYDILKETKDIQDFLALSKIQIRRDDDGHFVRETISNNGVCTTRGGSDIGLHVSTMERIKEQYSHLLSIIEENHIIGASAHESGARAQGSPVVIQFSKSVPDVEEFLSHVVNAQDPFRLWGHIRKTSENACVVDGMDAHNGDKIGIEMSSEWMRVYLYEGACGNTALRLFTNLQQYYDPAAELIITDA